MKVSFIEAGKAKGGIGVFLIHEGAKFSQDICKHDYTKDLEKVLKVKKHFKGKNGQILTFIPTVASEFSEIILLGVGKEADMKNECAPSKLRAAGGKLVAYLNGVEIDKVTLCINVGKKAPISATEVVHNIFYGMKLKNYKFTKYFVDKETDNKMYFKSVEICMHDSKDAKKLIAESEIVLDNVNFVRDLVSEPANVLYPESFAAICKGLKKSGLKVTVLGEKEMKKLGMNSLLGVGQGSARDSQLVVMEWHGAKSKKDAPLAFVGKGVTFDTGGISIKPSANMGDMKYDMGGAGAVTGLMKTLAERKAKVNAIGVIGLVENMPSGTAQRPGDVVKSMSGQTIEIDNTDAEGRLVLADAMWYTQSKFKPKFMIDLATLTCAIVMALGENIYAGMYSNDDKLADQLYKSGQKSGDKVWRMPLCESYDKQINSEIADVKNTGNGRGAGSITAAQFLKRFTNKATWAHLDIAGMAWDKSGADASPKGATGFGVKILNQLVKDFYE